MCAEESKQHASISVNQDISNELMIDLVLPKEKSDLLNTLLKQWNLLDTGTKVILFLSLTR